jgi:hypothetical protein
MTPTSAGTFLLTKLRSTVASAVVGSISYVTAIKIRTTRAYPKYMLATSVCSKSRSQTYIGSWRVSLYYARALMSFWKRATTVTSSLLKNCIALFKMRLASRSGCERKAS